MRESERKSMAQNIKFEIGCSNSQNSEIEANDSDHRHVSNRRTLRSRYLAVKHLIFGNFAFFLLFFFIIICLYPTVLLSVWFGRT